MGRKAREPIQALRVRAWFAQVKRELDCKSAAKVAITAKMARDVTVGERTDAEISAIRTFEYWSKGTYSPSVADRKRLHLLIEKKAGLKAQERANAVWEFGPLEFVPTNRPSSLPSIIGEAIKNEPPYYYGAIAVNFWDYFQFPTAGRFPVPPREVEVVNYETVEPNPPHFPRYTNALSSRIALFMSKFEDYFYAEVKNRELSMLSYCASRNWIGRQDQGNYKELMEALMQVRDEELKAGENMQLFNMGDITLTAVNQAKHLAELRYPFYKTEVAAFTDKLLQTFTEKTKALQIVK